MYEIPVYIEVAKKCFSKFHPYMRDETKQAILERKSFNEIEAYVPIQKIAEKICAEMGKATLEYVPLRLFCDVNFADDPEPAIKNLIDYLAEMDFSEYFKVKLAYKTLQAAHEEWMKIYEDYFFLFPNMRPRFMPFELIGIEAAMDYRVYTDDILQSFGLLPNNPEDVEKLYVLKQDEYIEKHRLFVVWRGREVLADHLMKIGEPIPKSISQTIKNNKNIAIDMARS